MGRPRNESGIARDEQTTIRASKAIVHELRLIAAKERTNMFDITSELLSDFVERYRKFGLSLLDDPTVPNDAGKNARAKGAKAPAKASKGAQTTQIRKTKPGRKT